MPVESDAAVEPRRDHPAQPVVILHLEDDALDGELVREILGADGMDCIIDRVWDRAGFSGALSLRRYDLILADHHLPNFDGHGALTIAREMSPRTPFVFVSGALGEEVAVEALKRGATDYVIKQRIERLPAVARRALNEFAEREERRRAETALRDSEENFSTLVNAMPLLCWMADSRGDATWFNQRWYDYTGTDFDTMKKSGWTLVHHPDFMPKVVRQWILAVASGRPFEMVYPLRGADGEFRTFLTRAHPVKNRSGDVVRWLGTNTDVSAQYEAEEALRRLNETLEQRIVGAIAEREAMLGKLHETQKLETIGQLTGGVAHGFNNLLTPILGSLDLLRRRVGDDDRANRALAAATRAAERAKTLVQRLLAFGRRQVLEPRAVDVPALVDGMIELIARSMGPRIAITVTVAEGVQPARVDPGQLELALLNLAVNARDAMPDGGSLSIEVGPVTVGEGQESPLRHGHYVSIAVTDTGIGMDDTTLTHAIEPFFSTKIANEGTGLGLSMVHGLAAQSGGRLVLTSTQGAGTRAEIWLPVAYENAEQASAPPDGVSRSQSPIRILLVDDETPVREVTAEMLTDLGHAVVKVGSASEALQWLAKDGPPDLVITDYLMPGMNGEELAGEIRRRHIAVPILMVTGYASLAGNTMPDLPLLPKPYRQAELAAAIERLVGGGRA
jgi:PAS domain S-box-containing protein